MVLHINLRTIGATFTTLLADEATAQGCNACFKASSASAALLVMSWWRTLLILHGRRALLVALWRTVLSLWWAVAVTALAFTSAHSPSHGTSLTMQAVAAVDIRRSPAAAVRNSLGSTSSLCRCRCRLGSCFGCLNGK
jgi:hypothetical protein